MTANAKIERRDLIFLVPLKLLPAMKDYIWGGTRLSKEYDLYRQDYCGCVYSIRNDQEQKTL